MNEETEKILKENLEISKESLKILRGIRRANRFSAAFKILYWFVIIGGLVGAYYYFQPLIKSAMGIVQQVQQALSVGPKAGNPSPGLPNISPDTLKNLPPDLFKQLQNFLKTK